MKILFESDRECTIDGVGLLEPGKPVEVDPYMFEVAHGVKPTLANLPYFVNVTVEVNKESDSEPNKGGE